MPTNLVRNNQAGPSVFTDDRLKQQVEWQGSGDPNGLDIQPVPDDMLDSVHFQRAVVRGIFSIEEGTEKADEIFAMHRREWEDRQDRANDAGKEALDLVQDKDELVLSCIGPKGHTGELCGEQVLVKSAKRNEAPPLCAKHQNLKPKFLPEESGRIVNGKPEVVWRRATVGVRERQES